MQGDREEARAIGEVFAKRADAVPIVAAKSYFGNIGAGGGALELIASILAMRDGLLFSTLNFEVPDPECPIAVVQSGDVPAGTSVMNVNVTPQGQASALLVRLVS